MLDFLIFAATLIIFLVISLIYLYPGAKKVTTIPGPEPIDTLEGNLPDITASGSLHEFLVDLHEHYGSIASFWFGPRLCVSIASPELFKQHSKAFDRPALLFELFEPLIGPGSIQYCNGAEGRLRHSTYGKQLCHEALSKYFKIFQMHAERRVKRLMNIPKEEHIATTELGLNFAMRVILHTCFGEYFEDEKEIEKLRQAYESAWGEMEKRLDGRPTDTERDHLFDRSKEVLYGTIKKVLTGREKAAKMDEDYRVIDAIQGLTMPESSKESDALSFMIGGFHTSGLLVAWALYFIARHPEVQDKLYEELQAVLGDNDVTLESMGHLPYMRQVLDETLRCSVLAPFAARYQEFDSELGGHKIPAGTPVVHALGVILQDETLWPEPETFDPERFSSENRNSMENFSFEPFGFAGGRKCPGWKFGYTELTVFLATLVRNLKIKLIPGQVVTKVFGLVTRPKEEIWITVSERK